MRFGPLTLEQWDQTLHQVEMIVPPSPPPTPPSPATSPPPSPLPTLTWAERVARNSKFVPQTSYHSSPSSLNHHSLHQQLANITQKRPPPPRLRGMLNSGTSCFINVVLQALLACEPFRLLLLKMKNVPANSMLAKWVRLAHETISYPNDQNQQQNKNSSSSSTNHQLDQYPYISDDPIYPDWFFDILSSLDTQEDAREFLDSVLSDLHEEMRNILLAKFNQTSTTISNRNSSINSNHQYSKLQPPTSPNRSTYNSKGQSLNHHQNEFDDDLMATQQHINSNDNEGWEEVTVKGRKVEIHGGEFEPSAISKIFGGSLRSEVTRMHRKPSVTKEPFFCLALNIESPSIKTIEDAITAFCEPEFVGESANGKLNGDLLRKQVLLQTLPQVLILQLKRYEKGLGGLKKVDRTLQIPETLCVRRNLVHSPKGPRAWGPDKKYQLIAAITHIGSEIGNGHYTCDVRNTTENGETFWTSCDDSKLTPTTIKNVCWKPAYLLFYSAL